MTRAAPRDYAGAAGVEYEPTPPAATEPPPAETEGVLIAAQLRAVQFSAGVQMSESWSPACATFSFLTKPQAFAGEHCSARGGAAARRRGGGGGEHRHEATKTRARVTTEV